MALKKQIVVFDTGMGGKIFAEHFRKNIDDAEVVEIIDSANAPYGEKSADEVLRLAKTALQRYLGTDALIVLACNTVTVCAIDALRAEYPGQTFVGLEPAVKPAAKLTKNRRIMVLATPTTLESGRYRQLLDKYAADVTVYEPGCSGWAKKIDENRLTERDVRVALSPFLDMAPDVVVLACTHYLAIPREMLEGVFPDATIYSPLDSVTNNVKEHLRQQ